LWADCIRALRRAGFVCAAESPAAVMLVNAGRSVLLPRAPSLNEHTMLATLRGTRLSPEDFLALLGDEPSPSGVRPPMRGEIHEHRICGWTSTMSAVHLDGLTNTPAVGASCAPAKSRDR
jgi:hypothetical protein